MMRRKPLDGDEDVVILADGPAPTAAPATPHAPGARGGVSRGYQGWLDRTAMPQETKDFLESPDNDDLERWVREAVVGIWAGKPSVGLLEFHTPHVVPWTVREFARRAAFNGSVIHTFDKFAGQLPLHLVEVKRLWDSAKINHHDDYIQATAHDVSQAADILNLEINLRPIILVASLDIRESMTDAEYRVARSVVKACLGAGCPALLFYSDQSSFKELDRRGFFDNGDIPLVRIL